MTIPEFINLMKKYEKCPYCGCSTIGNGTGTLEGDTAKEFFRRTCSCGWSVTIRDGSFKITVPNSQKEVPIHGKT
jgi:hypothetical protein|uniref:DUF3797 domain-containing protein n=1 Tax=Siphoviridae sp. ctP6113 TaxID=2826318 RepID=A0A8S5MTR1_9CAUD|nr:MAG TPA: protein of unknown function (DUF3797) [Siphoviridae sp. ctP6113]